MLVRSTTRAARDAVLCSVALAALLVGCSSDEEAPPSPPPGADQDLGQTVPQEWLDHWCEAREAAGADEAVALLGEPTSRGPADGTAGATGEELVWEDDASGVQLILVTDDQAAVVDRSSSVPEDLPAEAQQALACG